ncbi:GNAT family N-acetyltransferase [Reyranella sp.]|uniref:GNAT family N-acetyltransferase n=1 Tax=Reyranella sp. TaxID=1929291 RepID=UPI003BAA2DA6
MPPLDQPLPPTPILETPRLILRPLAPPDIPALQRRFPRWEIVRHLGPQVPWPYPADGAATYVGICQGEMERGEKHHWSIRLRDGPDELVGCIDLWPDDGRSRDMRGFWLDPDFQGRGLMTEAADRVTDYAFRTLGWPYLWVSNAEGNRASARVKERQGAVLVDTEPFRFVEGEGRRMVWRLDRAAWLGRAAASRDGPVSPPPGPAAARR